MAHILKEQYGLKCNYGEDEFGPYIVSSYRDVNPRSVFSALNQIGVVCINCTGETKRYPGSCGYTVFYI